MPYTYAYPLAKTAAHYAARAAPGIGLGLMRAAWQRIRGRNKGKSKTKVGRMMVTRKYRQPWINNFVRNPLTPNGKFIDFVYEDHASQLTSTTAGTTGATESIYRLNSPYQPKFAGTKQPYGWDQAAERYNHYKVHSCQILVRFLSNQTDEIMTGNVLVQSHSNTTTVANQQSQYIGSLPGGWVGQIPPQGDMEARYQIGYTIRFLEGAQFDINSDAYSAVVSANPVWTPLLRIAASSMTSASAKSLHFTVKLVFRVQLYDRQTLAASTV